ncbi:MAG: hypothetical protein IJQ95_05675 [Paludibacteraceae bacterium]|nr:hypothetical protein [Paludibacteraceae bacterium]
MKDAIGGYFSLELRKGAHYHTNALRINTARNAFEYILRARKYAKVFLPYYTCQVLLEPIQKLHINVEYYPINDALEPVTLPALKANEAFLYTNYYGLKQATVEQLAKQYGTQLIVDNAQAFFAQNVPHIDTFYSARKFFGVPDGAYLYTDAQLDLELPQDESFQRMSHLLKRTDLCAESGFADYQENEESLCHHPIKRMSRLTEHLLASIDYESIKQIRRANYLQFEQTLQPHNLLKLPPLSKDAIPMVYPYWSESNTHIRQTLQQHRIYIATYWPNVLEWDSPMLEKNIVTYLLPLPIDQRYSDQDIENIKNLLI